MLYHGSVRLSVNDLFPVSNFPASILHKSIAGHYRPVSYPDGPITARYRFMQNAYWVSILNEYSCHLHRY